MSDSILNTVKNGLGIVPEYTAFDPVLITHINSAFDILNDVGVGPKDGFAIVDAAATWSQFLGPNEALQKRYAKIQTWMILRVRMWWDPPATSFAIAAMEKQLDEMIWRINATSLSLSYTDPVVVISSVDTPVLDGGGSD